MNFPAKLALTFAAASLAVPAAAQSVHWASKPADGPAGPTTAAVLAQPDGIATSISFYAASYVRDFQPGKVSAAAIEKALKLPAGELAKWDVIAIENKTIDPAMPGFDSAMWMVSDLNRISSVVYDGKTRMAAPGTGPGWTFKTGTLSNAEFKATFGPAPRAFGDYAWLLIKLPSTMDKRSDRLAIWLSGGPIPGSASDPSPDAIGVIR